MSRRSMFDPSAVPAQFWHRDDVRVALARREVGRLFGIYLGAFPDCTQARLALLTEHDRSDISNFVRGTRSSRVTDIDVLHRIAEGLAMPDNARTLLGLASVHTRTSPEQPDRPNLASVHGEKTTTGWYRPEPPHIPLRVALCGSRSANCDHSAIDDAISALSRLLLNRRCEIDHGPVGIGIETMTYIADHYRPPSLLAAVGVFGRSNVVRHADFVLVIGGGSGTLDEVELAFSMSKRLIPFVRSGGAACSAYERMASETVLRMWMSATAFESLGACASAEQYVKIVEQLFVETEGGALE